MASPSPSQKQRKSIGRGHTATSSLIPTRSVAAWVICGGSEGAAAGGSEGSGGRLSACSQEQREDGRVTLYLREPWGRRCDETAPAWRMEMRRRASVCVKQGEDAAPLLCAREMRDDLRRDNDTLVGCLLGWANHSLYIFPFLFFLFPFFPFSCLFPVAIFLFLIIVRQCLASPYGCLGAT